MENYDDLLDTVWKHRNGNFYIIVEIANRIPRNEYQPTVWYRNYNTGAPYSRLYSDWHRSMTKCTVVEAGKYFGEDN